MLIINIFRSGLKLGHVGSKTRSLDQILEIHSVHSKRHSFGVQVGSKIRLLGQISEKLYVHS